MKEKPKWLISSSLQAQALNNLNEILKEAGSSLKNVVKVTIFLTDMANFAAMNRVYDTFFADQPKPVRFLHVQWSRPVSLSLGRKNDSKPQKPRKS